MKRPSPPKEGSKMPARVVTLQIDGRDVAARGAQMLIEVARESDIRIPKLCYVSGLSSYGGCRMCLVEVEGTSKLLAACTTAVTEGMQVRTVTPRWCKQPAVCWYP